MAWERVKDLSRDVDRGPSGIFQSKETRLYFKWEEKPLEIFT